MRKIFTLRDKVVQNLRSTHPLLKGKPLLGSGTFSGVFEGSSEDTVLKLTIDEASYIFHTDELLRRTGQHFTKVLDNYGKVGTFTTSKNIKRTKITQPIELDVPVYLYEVERLEKIPTTSEYSTLARKLSRDWRREACQSGDLEENVRALHVVQHLRDNSYFQFEHPTIMDALEEVGTFIRDYGEAFPDIHSGNMMQRKDGSFVLSDPIGDTRIYNAHYSFAPLLV